jgi:hypothetical protein
MRIIPPPVCSHDHTTCPEDITTIKCAYCGESLYQSPVEETEEELASLASDHTWQMFRRIYSNCGVHDALLWWKQTMEKGGYVL